MATELPSRRSVSGRVHVGDPRFRAGPVGISGQSEDRGQGGADPSLTNYRSRVVQESKGRTWPSLPSWNEWLYLTDQLVFDAWEAAMDTLPEARPPTDIRAVGRLCRTVMNHTWSPWHDSSPPPESYNLRKPVPRERELMGECDPRLEANRGIVCALAGREGRSVGSVQWEVAVNTTLLLKVPLAPPRTYPRLDRARLPPKQSLEWETYHAPRARVAY